MNRLSFDDEDYYFQISEELESDKEFILIIYDIVENKKRVKFAKLLSGYGIRVQKSAFEAMLTKQRYNKLIEEIPHYIDKCEDSVRIYKVSGREKVISWGEVPEFDEENKKGSIKNGKKIFIFTNWKHRPDKVFI